MIKIILNSKSIQVFCIGIVFIWLTGILSALNVANGIVLASGITSALIILISALIAMNNC